MTERNFETDPYSVEEQRVADYIYNLTGIGGGDDPVGFLIASHAYLAGRLRELLPRNPKRAML